MAKSKSYVGWQDEDRRKRHRRLTPDQASVALRGYEDKRWFGEGASEGDGSRLGEALR